MSEQGEVERLRRTLRVSRFVADHWRKGMLEGVPGTAHPLCMVLAALDGETDPAECGIDPDEYPAFAAVLAGEDQ